MVLTVTAQTVAAGFVKLALFFYGNAEGWGSP